MGGSTDVKEKTNMAEILKQILKPTYLSTFHLLCYYITDYSLRLRNTSKWRESLYMQPNAKAMLGFGLIFVSSICLT